MIPSLGGFTTSVIWIFSPATPLAMSSASRRFASPPRSEIHAA